MRLRHVILLMTAYCAVAAAEPRIERKGVEVTILSEGSAGLAGYEYYARMFEQ